MRYWLSILVAVVVCTWAAESLADPPAHAPAHGWRKKHDPYYKGYSGTTWERDYDVVTTGRCNRQEIGAVLGGVAGAVIGSRVSSPDNRTVGTIVGAAIGALIGSRIGRELDEGDRGCFGHVLEVAAPGARVTWDNPATGLSYALVPGPAVKSGTRTCRDFTFVASARSGEEKRSGRACQSGDRGVWQIM